MKGMLFKPWKIKFIAEHPDMELMTRRVIKFPRFGNYQSVVTDWDISITPNGLFITPKDGIVFETTSGKPSRGMQDHLLKPRYRIGETVYIKERWATKPWIENNPAQDVWYKDSGDIITPIKWHSPMRMPEWAARYFIVITDVRAERLQEITIPDAESETGIKFNPLKDWSPEDCLSRFESLWNSINKLKWEDNPWVWVYSFKLKA